MTYFADLSPYRYGWMIEPASLTVGWLDAPHPFPIANPDPALLDRLWERCCQRDWHFAMRGYHSCTFCGSEGAFDHCHNGVRSPLGSSEIRVIGRDGRIYAAPNLIFHYVRDHRYRPPEEFLEALRSGWDCASATHQITIRRLAVYRYALFPFMEGDPPPLFDPADIGLDDVDEAIAAYLANTGKPHPFLRMIGEICDELVRDYGVER